MEEKKIPPPLPKPRPEDYLGHEEYLYDARDVIFFLGFVFVGSSILTMVALIVLNLI